jgi:hypothetical protein
VNRSVSIVLFSLLSLACAHAHRITVDWQIHEGVLEIRASTGLEPALGAAAEIRDASGTLLTAGTLNDDGRFRWPVRDLEGPLHLTVDAGLGHRRSLTLTAQDLRRAATPMPPHDPSAPPTPAYPPAQTTGAHGTTNDAFSPVVRVGLGLTFLLALSAAWMSVRNHQRLSRLERELGGRNPLP